MRVLMNLIMSLGKALGSKPGLNIADSNGERVAPGTDPDGNSIEMVGVNVHAGVPPEDDPGGLNRYNRGSAGCPTCHPSDAPEFLSDFDFNGNTGTVEGSTTIFRGDSQNAQVARDKINHQLGVQEFLQGVSLQRPIQSDNTRVATPVFLRRRD